MMPALAPTMSIQKSGAWPVMPNMVVLRYFSCPARSMKVMTLEEARQMCTQSRPPVRRRERGKEEREERKIRYISELRDCSIDCF